VCDEPRGDPGFAASVSYHAYNCSRVNLDFGYVDELDSEAIGEPGNRVFRIRARSGERTVSLWLEKQQLQALSLAIRQMLDQAAHSAQPGPDLDPAIPMQDFPQDASLDIRVGRLALGWDDSAQRVILQAYELGAPDDEPAAFSCHTSAEHAIAFCDVSDSVVAGGRPLCFLCREPIGPEGHACVRSNGHKKDDIPTLEGDDEAEGED
jgi:uncharacterized repeat protein (TIGR03847 family)